MTPTCGTYRLENETTGPIASGWSARVDVDLELVE